MGDNGGECSIAGHKRSTEGFGEGQIDRVVGRSLIPELPDPWQKEVVRIADEGEGRKVFERLKPSGRVELT